MSFYPPSATEDEPPDDPYEQNRAGMWSRVLDRDQLAHLPQPAPLIDGTLDKGTVTLLAGYYGTLKSFIALDWGASVATGRPWMGRAVQQGKVLYVAAEGAHGLHQRVAAWEYAWSRKVDPGAFHVLPEPVNLGNSAAVTELCHVVENAGYGYVIVDTLAKSIAGMDENSAQDMGRAVAALYKIRTATGDGTVLPVHHTGKDKTTVRGSSALESGVDAVYTTEGDAQLVKLTRAKRKDGPCEDVHQLRLRTFDHLGSGAVESVRLSAGDSATTAAERHLMSAYLSVFDATGASKAELRNVADMPPATFHRSLSALVRGGLLVNHGTEQRPFYRAGES